MEGPINYNRLAELVRKKIREEKLTLRAAASVSNISSSTLSRILRGVTVPDTDNLAKLAIWLNVSFDELLRTSPSQFMLNGRWDEIMTSSGKDEVEVHFRGKREHLDAYPDEVRETIVKIIRLAAKNLLEVEG